MATSNELEDNQVATLHQYPVITPCDLCDTKEDVTCFCRNCSQNLCGGCKRTHLRSTVSRDHNIVHISEGKSSESEVTSCTKHGERLFFYCRTCSVLFCPKCLDPTHKSHDILDSDKYAEELQSKLALLIEKKSKEVEKCKRNVEHIEERKKTYVDTCSKSKESVMNAIKILQSQVYTIQTEFLAKICHHEALGLARFDEAKHQEKTKGDELQESLDILIRQSKKHDNISLVAYASKLSIDDRHTKKNDEAEVDSKSDIASLSVPTVDFRAAKLSTKVISEVLGTLCISHADDPRKSAAESTKKIQKSLTKQHQTIDIKIPQESDPKTKYPMLCTCNRPYLFPENPNICKSCWKNLKRK